MAAHDTALLTLGLAEMWPDDLDDDEVLVRVRAYLGMPDPAQDVLGEVSEKLGGCLMMPLRLNFMQKSAADAAADSAADAAAPEDRVVVTASTRYFDKSQPFHVVFRGGNQQWQDFARQTLLTKVQPFMAMKLVFTTTAPSGTTNGCTYLWDLTGGYAGLAYVGNVGSIAANTLRINPSTSPMSDFVCLHEFLHVMGAQHSFLNNQNQPYPCAGQQGFKECNPDHQSSVMSYYGRRELSAADKEWLGRTYGAGTGQPPTGDPKPPPTGNRPPPTGNPPTGNRPPPTGNRPPPNPNPPTGNPKPPPNPNPPTTTANPNPPPPPPPPPTGKDEEEGGDNALLRFMDKILSFYLSFL
jgi:hypothetical protein